MNNLIELGYLRKCTFRSHVNTDINTTLTTGFKKVELIKLYFPFNSCRQ